MKIGLRMLVGLAFWSALGWIIFEAGWGTPHEGARSTRWLQQMRQHSAGTRTALDLHLQASRELAVGDPIFIELPDGTLRQVGQISSLRKTRKRWPRVRRSCEMPRRCSIRPLRL